MIFFFLSSQCETINEYFWFDVSENLTDVCFIDYRALDVCVCRPKLPPDTAKWKIKSFGRIHIQVLRHKETNSIVNRIKQRLDEN